MGVIHVTQLFHLQHVFSADTLVATLIEEDARVVAIVDNGVAHQRRALCPPCPLHVFLGVTGRHGLYESHAVARLHILFPRCDMHPAHEVATRLDNETVAIVTHPCRHADAHGRPLVAGALRVAVHHDNAVVEPYFALAKTSFTEACADDDLIRLRVKRQRVVGSRSLCQESLHGVEISIPPRPEMQSV